MLFGLKILFGFFGISSFFENWGKFSKNLFTNISELNDFFESLCKKNFAFLYLIIFSNPLFF